jgi:hypothetical protein
MVSCVAKRARMRRRKHRPATLLQTGESGSHDSMDVRCQNKLPGEVMKLKSPSLGEVEDVIFESGRTCTS